MAATLVLPTQKSLMLYEHAHPNGPRTRPATLLIAVRWFLFFGGCIWFVTSLSVGDDSGMLTGLGLVALAVLLRDGRTKTT